MLACPRCHSIYTTEIEFCGMDGDRLVELENDPLIGQTIDRYRILEQLGTGGMGNVYRATHQVLEHEYAIKVLFGEMAANKTLAERFRREAQAVSKMRHPNIVSVVDFGTTPSGLTFLTMELLRGRTLGDALIEEGVLPPRRVARIARQIADGLGEAHRLGFVHRDLKPGNVMLVDQIGDELVKVLDFGIVGFADVPDKEKLTRPGFVLGTPTYMAPEQVYQSSVNGSADLYALGTIMYEMLTGKPPFVGDQLQQVIVRQLTEAPAPLGSYGGLEVLTHQLLEKAPENRPASALDVIAEIDRVVDALRGRSGRRRIAPSVTRPDSPRPNIPRSMTPAAGAPIGTPVSPRGSTPRPGLSHSSVAAPIAMVGPPIVEPMVADLTPVAFVSELMPPSRPGEPLAPPRPRSPKTKLAAAGAVIVAALTLVLLVPRAPSPPPMPARAPATAAPDPVQQLDHPPAGPKISAGTPDIALEPAADPRPAGNKADKAEAIDDTPTEVPLKAPRPLSAVSDDPQAALLAKAQALGRQIEAAPIPDARRPEIEQRYKTVMSIVTEKRSILYEEAQAEIWRLNRILLSLH